MVARKKNYKIVFPEKDDKRVFEAASYLSAEKLAQIVWLDEKQITPEHVSTILVQVPFIFRMRLAKSFFIPFLATEWLLYRCRPPTADRPGADWAPPARSLQSLLVI